MEKEQLDLPFGGRFKAWLSAHWQGLVIIITPIVFLPVMLTDNDKAHRCMYLFCVMAVFWVTEALPLPVSSMLPVLGFPLMGIMDSDLTCRLYFKDLMVMLLASYMIALAIEFNNLHTRMALKIIKRIGCSPGRLHLGVTCVTGFMSLWIANVATTAMMLPIVSAVIDQLSAQGMCKAYEAGTENLPPAERKPSRFATGFYLSICYASSVGGIGTLIGTPTNLAIKGLYEARFPESVEDLEFPTYMAYAFPPTAVNILMIFLLMQLTFMGLFRAGSDDAKEISSGKEAQDAASKVISEKIKDLGPMSSGEITVSLLFITLIALFFTRKPGIFYGWADYFNEKKVGNSAGTVLILLLLFSLPANYVFGKFWSKDKQVFEESLPCITWQFVNQKTPWRLIFLIGGGGALAEASKVSGMSKLLGKKLIAMENFPPSVVLLITMMAAGFGTNFTANIAVANILLPVLLEMAVYIKIHPLYLSFPVGITCSMAFMLPTGTPANAVAQSYANIPTKSMMIAGFLPTIVTVLVYYISHLTLGTMVYPNLNHFPSWAETPPADEAGASSAPTQAPP